jgi:hypothetical protein
VPLVPLADTVVLLELDEDVQAIFIDDNVALQDHLNDTSAYVPASVAVPLELHLLTDKSVIVGLVYDNCQTAYSVVVAFVVKLPPAEYVAVVAVLDVDQPLNV